jgi:hypothetical protein
MRAIGFLIALGALVMISGGPSQAASSFGCSQDKCFATCAKNGGRINGCARWCTEQIRKDPKCTKK